jgi:putative transposase
MKQECQVAATSKRRRYGSYMGEISPAPENRLNRDFSAGAPNETWLSDITEFQIPAGKVYLSPMIDCFDDMVVSCSIGTRPDAELFTRCWMPPSTRLRPAAIDLWSIRIVAATIGGQAG